MLNIVLIIGVIAAIMMILVVLVQNPKGGGLASNFSSSNQIFGVKRTSEGVEKMTWIFAVVILCVSLLSSASNSSNPGDATTPGNTEIDNMMNITPKASTSKPAENNTAPEVPPGGGEGATTK